MTSDFPQPGDEVIVRGIVTQRAIDTMKRDVIQVDIAKESYFFTLASHAEKLEKDSTRIEWGFKTSFDTFVKWPSKTLALDHQKELRVAGEYVPILYSREVNIRVHATEWSSDYK